MARTFIKYLKEMTGAAAAGGTMTSDIATFARPIGAGPVKRIYPSSVLGIDSARITHPPKTKKKKTKRN